MTLSPFGPRHAGGRLAPLLRWDPRREIEDLTGRFNQLMTGFLGEPGGPSVWAVPMPVDIEETDEAYVIDVDLPNVDPQQVDLEIRGDELRITGTFQQRQRGGVMRRQDRRTGEFEYLIDLPTGINPNEVNADYHNGVLTVTVAKAQESVRRKVEIRVPGEQGGEEQGGRKG
jgi:HSP20 family protein